MPVTDDVICWHLSGHDDDGRDFVMGVYPMLQDETCFFLAADFDKAHWREDAEAVLQTCRGLNLPAFLERSRSGNGGHVWWFFAEAIPAALARRLGSHVLTETMERRPDIGLDSYDRFFPNQDTIPHGGFGNLIALPLQKDRGNLATASFWTSKGTRMRIRGHCCRRSPGSAATPSRRSSATPNDADVLSVCGGPCPMRKTPSLGPCRPRAAGQSCRSPGRCPRALTWYSATRFTSPKMACRRVSAIGCCGLAAFQNPEFYKAQAMRLPTYDKPRIIGCAEDLHNYLGMPRGCLEEVQELLSNLHIKAVTRDERYAGVALDVKFQGELRPQQATAAEECCAMKRASCRPRPPSERPLLPPG